MKIKKEKERKKELVSYSRSSASDIESVFDATRYKSNTKKLFETFKYLFFKVT